MTTPFKPFFLCDIWLGMDLFVSEGVSSSNPFEKCDGRTATVPLSTALSVTFSLRFTRIPVSVYRLIGRTHFPFYGPPRGFLKLSPFDIG